MPATLKSGPCPTSRTPGLPGISPGSQTRRRNKTPWRNHSRHYSLLRLNHHTSAAPLLRSLPARSVSYLQGNHNATPSNSKLPLKNSARRLSPSPPQATPTTSSRVLRSSDLSSTTSATEMHTMNATELQTGPLDSRKTQGQRRKTANSKALADPELAWECTARKCEVLGELCEDK